MTVTVKRIGGSFAIVIPRAVAVESKLSEGLALDVSSTHEGILLRTIVSRPRRSIRRIAAAIKPQNYAVRNADQPADAVVGKERW